MPSSAQHWLRSAARLAASFSFHASKYSSTASLAEFISRIKARLDGLARRDTRHTNASRRQSLALWDWPIQSRNIHPAHALRRRDPDRNVLRAAAADRR